MNQNTRDTIRTYLTTLLREGINDPGQLLTVALRLMDEVERIGNCKPGESVVSRLIAIIEEETGLNVTLA